MISNNAVYLRSCIEVARSCGCNFLSYSDAGKGLRFSKYLHDGYLFMLQGKSCSAQAGEALNHYLLPVTDYTIRLTQTEL